MLIVPSSKDYRERSEDDGNYLSTKLESLQNTTFRAEFEDWVTIRFYFLRAFGQLWALVFCC